MVYEQRGDSGWPDIAAAKGWRITGWLSESGSGNGALHTPARFCLADG
jgi:hypothetical protein